MSKVQFATLAVGLILTTTVAGQDKKKIDNPEYTSWSKYKPGTTVKMTIVNNAGGQKFEIARTSKLVEVTAEKCVLEDEGMTKVAGMEVKQPATKRDVPKTLEVDAKSADAIKAVKPEGTTEEGTETLKVSGTEIKTKWYKFKSKAAGGAAATEGQMWMSEEVPGLMVKMTTKTDQSEMKMELVEFTKK
jgi:hypothetical protein